MESESAGLDACRAIRNQLANRLVRLLLRTGQPGVAPEKTAIDEYDIDGYLLKTELTTTRLYAAVRTALKAYEELVELQRHRELLALVNEAAASLHAFDDVEISMQKVLANTAALTNARFCMMSLESFDSQGDRFCKTLHQSSEEHGDEKPQRIAELINDDRPAGTGLTAIGDGFVIPIQLFRDLGSGWIYFEGAPVDDVLAQVLPMLAAHVCNSLYAVVAQQILEDREGPFYDSLGI